MPVKKPTPDQVFQFVSQTHEIEKIPCPLPAVTQTATSNKKNWYADGHLRAISYIINKLVDSTDFPSRNPIISNTYDSEQALHWLKHIHQTILLPIANNPTQDDPLLGNTVTLEKIEKIALGKWRYSNTLNLYTPPPTPTLIPTIMMHWLKNLSNIHEKVKNHVDNPYGITKAIYKEMTDFTNEQPAFFSSVQPFQYANNRMGRLMQITLNLAWRQPFNYHVASQYEKFKESLEEFQINKLPKLISHARSN